MWQVKWQFWQCLVSNEHSAVSSNLYLPSHCLKQIIQLLLVTSLCRHWSHLLSHGSLHSLFLEWFSATMLLWPTWTPAESSVLVNWGHQASTSVAQRMALPVMSTSSQSLPGMQQDWVTPTTSPLVFHHVSYIYNLCRMSPIIFLLWKYKVLYVQ